MFLSNFLFFLLLSIVFFSITGAAIFKVLKIKISGGEGLILSTTTGLCFYSLASLFFHSINLVLILPILVVLLNIYFFKRAKKKDLPKLSIKPKSILVILPIFLLGITGQLAVISFSGTKTSNGDLIFYSSNGHDGMWHIAVMNEIERKFPLQNPSFGGERLINYHFLSDIAAADFNLFFKISSIDLYFRYFPFLYSLLLGSLAYALGKRISDSVGGGCWAAIFVYFSGSFGYIATLLKNGSLGGESIFWASQIQSSSGNPPQIFSDVIFLATLLFFFHALWKNERSLLFIIIILASSLSVTKIYASIVFISAFGLLSLFRLLKDKKYDFLLACFLIILLSLLIYISNVSTLTESKSFLIFQPWWFIRTMIAEPSRLNLVDWELRRQTYLYERNYLRVAEIEIGSFLIFLIGNLGTKILGLFWYLKQKGQIFKNYLYSFTILISAISILFPLLFLQKGVAGNTIQTFQYFLLVFAILAGISVNDLIKSSSKFIKFILPATIIVASIPTQIGLIYEFYSKPPLSKITASELEALDFLKENSPRDSIVVSPPYDRFSIFKNQQTPPIWAWDSTSYIPAMSQRREFLADYEQLDIMGYDISQRKIAQKEIFSEKDEEKVKDLLIKNNIGYIYLPKKITPTGSFSENNFEKLFENEEIKIFKLKDI